MTHACITAKLLIRNICDERELNGIRFNDVVMDLIRKNGLNMVVDNDVMIIEIKPVLSEQVTNEECL